MNKFLYSLTFVASISAAGVLYSVTLYHVPTITVFRLKNELLIQAAAKGKEKLALTLLALPGINLSTKDKTGKTVLHHAAEKGLIDLTKALLARGADPKIGDSQGITASALAVKAGHSVIAKLLDV